MSELLNLVGLSTGVVLYAMLLAMLLRSRSMGGPFGGRQDRNPTNPLLLVAAILGLVWNLCALPAYELPRVGIPGTFPWLIAIGFCALGFLPAVVVHSALRAATPPGEGPSALNRAVGIAAYTVSAAAAFLQIEAVFTGREVPPPFAMRMLTYCFVGLVVPLVLVTRRQPGARRALWVSALAVFAVTALHLSGLHQDDRSWLVELLGHHASLPLAFAILYENYPFALADLFLKRALALLLLVVTSFIALALFSLRSRAFDRFVRVDPRQVGALVTLWVATALLYPALRRATGWFVDSVLLRRPDYQSLRTRVPRRLQGHETVPAVLDDVCDLLAPAVSARSVKWRELAAALVEETPGGTLFMLGEPATVIVPTTEEPRYALEIAQLTGGRRLLSDDLALLDAVAAIAGRRIDAIRLTRERYDREVREQEVAKLASEAELRALRAQINPHFLFNALTTIGYLIQDAPARALETLMRLTSLLRGVLGSEGEFTTLGRELELVESYLEIERARFEERLSVHIDVPFGLRDLRVPPLVVQPLVENAVKHGISRVASGGEVAVVARTMAGDDGRVRLQLTVRDTGAGGSPRSFARANGLGLHNVERRLACQYSNRAALNIDTAPGRGTTVTIVMPADPDRALSADPDRALPAEPNRALPAEPDRALPAEPDRALRAEGQFAEGQVEDTVQGRLR